MRKPWLVLFDCGHARLPEFALRPGMDDDGNGPPRIGDAGWCRECHDFRITRDVVL